MDRRRFFIGVKSGQSLLGRQLATLSLVTMQPSTGKMPWSRNLALPETRLSEFTAHYPIREDDVFLSPFLLVFRVVPHMGNRGVAWVFEDVRMIRNFF